MRLTRPKSLPMSEKCTTDLEQGSSREALGRSAEFVQEMNTKLHGSWTLDARDPEVQEGGGETLGLCLDGSRHRIVSTQKRCLEDTIGRPRLISRRQDGWSTFWCPTVLSLGCCRDQRCAASAISVCVASSTSPRPYSGRARQMCFAPSEILCLCHGTRCLGSSDASVCGYGVSTAYGRERLVPLWIGRARGHGSEGHTRRGGWFGWRSERTSTRGRGRDSPTKVVCKIVSGAWMSGSLECRASGCGVRDGPPSWASLGVSVAMCAHSSSLLLIARALRPLT